MKLAYLGSISISSGHRVDLLPDILSQVREELPDIELHMFGDGDDVEKLKRMFAEKNLASAVTWHGRFRLADSPRVLAGSVILDPIDASISNRAKSSFRVLYAASLGLLVVTSNVGIRPYLLPQEFHERFFARPETTTDYAEKIIACIKNPLTLEEINILRKHSEQFSWQTLAEKYEKIIDDEK